MAAFHPSPDDTAWGYPHGLPSTFHPLPGTYHQQQPLTNMSYSGTPQQPPHQNHPGHRPPQPLNNNHAQPQFGAPTFDPRATLDPRGTFSRQPVSNGAHNADFNAPSGEGHGNMIERMHNVQNREVAPSKRKVHHIDDDDEGETGERKKPKTSFNGNANGGVISDHLRKEREKLGAAGPTETVDLTQDDDDEIQIVQENKAEEVVLGVTFAKAAIHRIPPVSERAAMGIGSSHWPKTKIDFKRKRGADSVIELIGKNGSVFGKMEQRYAKALAPLLDGAEQNKFKMSVWLEARPKLQGEQIGQSVSQYLTISIIMRAPRGKGNVIGKYLSQHQIFLTAPKGPQAIHQAYENPQLPKDFRPGETMRKSQVSMPSITSRTIEEMRRDANTMFDSLVKHEDLPDTEPPTELISTELLSHQKKALSFLLEHESKDHEGFSLWKPDRKANGKDFWYNVITGHELDKKPESIQGGILADMMGLGKTLSILSLLASTWDEARRFGEQDPPKDLNCERNVKTTLLLCPKSVMSNWMEQIRAHTVGKKFKVYAYHGTKRIQDTDELAEYNIVLTTYNTAAAEFNARNKALAAVNWFRIVLDEAHQIRNQSTRVSKAAMALHAERRWAVTGTPVQNGLGDLGALIKFLRVKPFDDNTSWNQYIISPFKVANTDVVANLRLLVDSMTLRRVKDTIDLPDKKETRVKLDFTDEERRVYSRVAGESNKQLRVMQGSTGAGPLKGKSYAHVLKSIGRLRMLSAHNLEMFGEDDRRDIMEGMDPDNAIAIDLGDEPGLEDFVFVSERTAYETLHMMNDSDMDRCAKCDQKVVKGIDTPEDSELEDNDSDSGSEEDAKPDTVMGYLTPCYHVICGDCKDGHVNTIRTNLTADERHECPYCQAYVRFGLFELTRHKFSEFLEARASKGKNPKGRKWDETNYAGPSTKVKALMQDLLLSVAETAELPEGEPPIRSVVFSGWTTYLDLIEIALDDHGMGYLRLDGKMSIRARTDVLDKFRNEPDKTVLLVSIKAGGQGLNFTAANKAYMMEPQFNPGVEQQAIDRVHRLGQKRDVFITHYIMRDSVEEGILKLQEKKEQLAKLTTDRKISAAEVRKENLEQLKELFK